MLITNAERSQDDQLRSREVRYVLMMSFRAMSLLVAVILVGAHAPLLWLWIPICLVGMVVVPWLAVILANDRPPRRRSRSGGTPTAPGAAPPEPLAIDSTRVIDADQ